MIAKRKLLELVREGIAKWNPPGGEFVMAIDEHGITKSNGWWHVPIYPYPIPERNYPYIDALAEIESELQDRQDLKVEILPAFKG